MNIIQRELLFKLVVNIVVAWLSLGIFDSNRFSFVLVYAIIITITNYIVGIGLMYPTLRTNVTAIVIGITSAVIAWLFGLIIGPFRTTFLTLVLLGVLVGVGEYLLHINRKN